MATHYDLIVSQITFAIALLYTGWLAVAMMKPPRGNPVRLSTYQDRFLYKPFVQLWFSAWKPLVILSITHPIISLLGPDDLPKAVCPNKANLNTSLFGWNAFTTTAMVVVWMAANLRLWCYRTLDKAFTFQITKPPKGLIKTGPYAYVQHPSYVCLMLGMLSYVALYVRQDATLGCWLPTALTQFKFLVPVHLACVAGLIVYYISVRVPDEEKLLRDEFGEEWEEYHKAIPRFLPFVI